MGEAPLECRRASWIASAPLRVMRLEILQCRPSVGVDAHARACTIDANPMREPSSGFGSAYYLLVRSRSSLLVAVLFACWGGLGPLAPVLARDFDVPQVPNPRQTHGGFVSDAGGLLGASARAQIESVFSKLQSDLGAEAALAIVPSIGTRDPKTFANELFDHWGVGRRELDDGVLILHVVDQRRFEIEVGYGLEPVLTDVLSARMLREIAIVRMQAGDVDGARVKLAEALVDTLRTGARTEAPAVRSGQGARLRSGQTPPSRGRALAGVCSLCLTLGAWAWLSYKRQKLLRKPQQAHRVFASLRAKAWVVLAGIAGGLLPDLLGAGGLWWDGLGVPAFACACAALFVLHHTAKRHTPGPAGQPEGYRRLVRVLSGGVLLLNFVCVSKATEASELLLGRVDLGYACLCLAWSWLLAQLRRTRLQPRVCSECHTTMGRLSDLEEERLLSAGEIAEQDLGARDYDVWLCPRGHSQVEEYAGHTSAERCQACAHATYKRIDTVILEVPTRLSPGLAEDHFRCFHCEHRDTIERRLPPTGSRGGRGWSGSGSSGGSSGGGSFGGGRSGGGGAGGSY